MCRVIARLVSKEGDTVGYFTSESDTRVYTPEEISARVSKGEISEFNDRDVFTVDNTAIEVSQIIRADSVSTAYTLRKLARLDRIKLDTGAHRISANRHLFDYLNYCDWDVLDYVKKYLQNIQPYMILRRKSQEPGENYLCVIDDMYATSLYIKLDTTKNDEVIVSFHESAQGMFAKSNRFRNQQWRYVPVIADQVKAYVPETDKRVITVWIMRGLICKECTVTATRAGNYYLADFLAIEAQLLSVVNAYMYEVQEGLKEKEFELDKEFYNRAVIDFSHSQQLSITSYGKDIVSTISLLMDNSLASNDPDYRKFADGLLAIYTGNLFLTDEERLRVYQVLQSRYQVQNTPRMTSLLSRVYGLLQTSLGPRETTNPVSTEDFMGELPASTIEGWKKEMQLTPFKIDILEDNSYQNDDGIVK